MNLLEFIEEVINRGIEAAKKDYPDGDLKLEGSIAGFEACRGKDVAALKDLLSEAKEETIKRHRAPIGSSLYDTYWWARCYELEVEWVCNCVAAVLVNEGHDSPFPLLPTARGARQAAEVLSGL